MKAAFYFKHEYLRQYFEPERTGEYKMKILITGGAGFIGSEIVNSLGMPAESIVVLDALTEQIHGKNSY